MTNQTDSIVTQKHCSKCATDYSLDAFYKNKSTSDGLGAYCKQCAKQAIQDIRNRPLEVVDGRLRSTQDILTRIFSRIIISIERFHEGEPCWEWQRGLDRDGYAYITYQSKWMYVHRLTYELFIELIPHPLEIDHLCRNRKCINPIHLEAVTSRENNLRGLSVSGINARKTHCKRGHEFTEENTYHNPAYENFRSCRICQRMHDRAHDARQRLNKTTSHAPNP